MTCLHKLTIRKALANALKHIPENPPLQGFVANNPLWGLIDKPIYEATNVISKTTNTQSTFPIQFYWSWYQNNKENKKFIEESLSEFIDYDKKTNTLRNKQDTKLFHQLLFQFTTSKKYQQKLTEINDTHFDRSELLLSKKIQLHGKHFLLNETKSACLNWLAVYFNPVNNIQESIIYNAEFDRQGNQVKFPFFGFWRNTVTAKNKKWKSIFSMYDNDIELFIEQAMLELLVPEQQFEQYIAEICWQLKGWVGYIKWCQNNPNHPKKNRQIKTSEVIAMWLAYELLWFRRNKLPTLRNEISSTRKSDYFFIELWQEHIQEIHTKLDHPQTENATEKFKFSFDQLRWIWQRAYELSYQQPLYETLLAKKSDSETADNTKQSQNKALAQWVFCIDVRSEGFRRHLEKNSHYETFGYAGFFGFAHQLFDEKENKLTHQCPVILNPELRVKLIRKPENFLSDLKHKFDKILKKIKASPLPSFALYEIVGLFFSITLMIKNFSYKFAGFLTNYLKKCSASEEKKYYADSIEIEKPDINSMITLASSFLKGIGLTKSFSKFVIICSHAATTENNPYQAALDCGACGGNGGMSNAILACEILNDKFIRKGLSEKAICILDETVFIAACHNTTTDKILWKSSENLAEKKQALLDSIKQDAAITGQQLQQERLKSLPGNKNVVGRSKDWAELIPEWGLANNAAMIIAPRKLTKSIDLERRVFLHSYDNESDPDGEILSSILLGPVIVAHWINSQYYFSSVDPCHYSSGNKAIHNVLANVGVMEGNQSDLKYGLPEQSLIYQGKNMHQPIRLCVFIDAKEKKIHTIIDKNPVLKSLTNGHWLYVKSLNSATTITND